MTRSARKTNPFAELLTYYDPLNTLTKYERYGGVYSDAFIAVSAYLPRDQRVFTLADKIAVSLYDEAERQQTTAQAEALIVRDDLEPHEELGQHIRETFPLADGIGLGFAAKLHAC